MPCTAEQLAALLLLVQPQAAHDICLTFDIGDTPIDQIVKQYAVIQGAQGLREQLGAVQNGLDADFVLFSGYLVFIMQAGFAMLCAGCVRSKNSSNILLKNLADACVGGLFYYLLGYGFQTGSESYNGFIGSGNWALYQTMQSPEQYPWQSFFFNWTFSAAAATIVSGAVAERITFPAYLLYTCFTTSFVYPVVAYWMWSENGWLSAYNPNPLFGSGAIDFSGSGVVHLVGGTASLIGVWALGPRLGRFDADGQVNKRDFQNSNSVTYLTLGTFLLWFGWYGFNPGSVKMVSTVASATTAARTAVCTTLAGAAGASSGLLFSFIVSRREWDLLQLCNGALCGLVSVTAMCSVVQPYAAIVAGMLAAPLFWILERVLWRARLDDVVAAVPMHGASGLLGVLLTGFFAFPDYVNDVYAGSTAARYGVFYGGTGHLLACQIMQILVTVGWVCALHGCLFFGLQFLGVLRAPPEQELAGLDASKYGVITTNELPYEAQQAIARGGTVAMAGYHLNRSNTANGAATPRGGQRPDADPSKPDLFQGMVDSVNAMARDRDRDVP